MQNLPNLSPKELAEFAKSQNLSVEELDDLIDYIDGGEINTHTPLSAERFLSHPDFMNVRKALWPKILDHLIEINSGNYIEAVLTGSIGSAKTTVALYTQAYQLYLLSTIKRPHILFGLDPASEIVFIFQNVKESLARSVDYERFRAMLERSRYFMQTFRFDPEIKSELRFPNRIVVKPVAGTDTAALGQNVISGVLDEVNFMEVIEKSTKIRGGAGGKYDQALALYSSIARRRKTRFNQAGLPMPGLLCIMSSKQYPGEFTDRKIQEAQEEEREEGKTSIYVYDKRVWEVAPAGKFSEETFNVFVGDESRKPRLLTKNETVSKTDKALVMPVPIDFERDFKTNLMDSIRDIAGVSTMAIHPFIMDLEAIEWGYGKTKSLFMVEWTDFETQKLKVSKAALKRFPDEPRYVHVDLGLVSDAAGLAIGRLKKFVQVRRGDGLFELLPLIVIEGILEVRPPPGGEIPFSKIREALYTLRDMGLNIKWVSYDSWQSTDSRQILGQHGFITGVLSMDKTTGPYDVTKQAILDRRLFLCEHGRAKSEFKGLERIAGPGKPRIDHRPNGSKDCSDAVAGVVWGLTMRRELWLRHGISTQNIPVSVLEHLSREPDTV